MILEYVDIGFKVFDVACEPPLPAKSPLVVFSANVCANGRRKKGEINWPVRSFVSEVKAELFGGDKLSIDKEMYLSRTS